MTNDVQFDCFLSHNSCDKPVARAIKNLITKNGLAAWLDEDELTPGTMNFVASDTVTGNMTLRLKNVPWDQALDIILKSKGLSLRQTGNVLLVAPTQEIVMQEEGELLTQLKIEELAPLELKFYRILHARARDLAQIFSATGARFLSERANISVDDRTNTIIVLESVNGHSQVRRFIDELDIPLPPESTTEKQ